MAWWISMRLYSIRITLRNCSRITTVETICIPTMQAAAPREMRFLSHCSKGTKLDSTNTEPRVVNAGRATPHSEWSTNLTLPDYGRVVVTRAQLTRPLVPTQGSATGRRQLLCNSFEWNRFEVLWYDHLCLR